MESACALRWTHRRENATSTGELLAYYIFLEDGEPIQSKMMIERGFWTRIYIQFAVQVSGKSLKKEEETARENKLGLWAPRGYIVRTQETLNPSTCQPAPA